MSDSRFRSNQAQAKLAELLPPWAPMAACSEYAPNNAPWGLGWTETNYCRDPDTHHFPKETHEAMVLCAGCPVREACLAYAFEAERREAEEWWRNDLVEEHRRFGVFGGVPDRVREFYADADDPVAECNAWFKRKHPDLDERGSIVA